MRECSEAAVLVIVASVIVASCGGDEPPECGEASGTAVTDSDLYAIHAAIIGKDFAANETVVIREQVSYEDDDDPAYLATVLKDASAETQADFLKKNTGADPARFEKKFALESYELLCSARYDHFTSGDRWDSLYETYKGAQGILSLSAAGYNGAGDEAVVYLRNMVSADRGEGYFVILKKESGEWSTKYRVRTWQE